MECGWVGFGSDGWMMVGWVYECRILIASESGKECVTLGANEFQETNDLDNRSRVRKRHRLHPHPASTPTPSRLRTSHSTTTYFNKP